MLDQAKDPKTKQEMQFYGDFYDNLEERREQIRRQKGTRYAGMNRWKMNGSAAVRPIIACEDQMLLRRESGASLVRSHQWNGDGGKRCNDAGSAITGAIN